MINQRFYDNDDDDSDNDGYDGDHDGDVKSLMIKFRARTEGCA